jgi:CheY-like chemotaxis protein
MRIAKRCIFDENQLMNALPLDADAIVTLSRFYDDVKHNKKRLENTIILLATLLNKKSLNILLADDDEGSRTIFVEAIAEIAPHVSVSVAVNGRKLMNTLLTAGRELPDIIFLDLNMPLKNGWECLQEIRNSHRLKDIPVIIYSTSANREHIDRTYEDGANFYLIKPDSFSDLKLMAKSILSLDWVKPIWPERESFVLIPAQFK